MFVGLVFWQKVSSSAPEVENKTGRTTNNNPNLSSDNGIFRHGTKSRKSKRTSKKGIRGDVWLLGNVVVIHTHGHMIVACVFIYTPIGILSSSLFDDISATVALY